MPSPRSPQAQRLRRKRLLSWVPTTIVALLCIGVVIAAIAVGDSWWSEPEPEAAVDQQAADGASLFTQAGVDFLTRQGELRVKLREDALSATDLGLEPDGERTIEPLVPVRAIVLGEEGTFSIELVDAFTLITEDDELVALRTGPAGPRTWGTAMGSVRSVAPSWGWTAEHLEQLDEDLTAASRGSDAYSAELPLVTTNGARVGARVDVDTRASSVTVTYTFRTL
ncbi:hypothetical protein Q9S36_32000 [Microbacterium sp. ARD31]|uniref:hypothetical protein n=1 Tax=Microbacterium sp. ARD31 TaxID=2962576 RepID=UPI002881EBF0|nr:hypothetical protein [Microbacterium sp. ARD31]MDT0184819.1 hypothetical protein [Microbacterium sp. ARD31]